LIQRDLQDQYPGFKLSATDSEKLLARLGVDRKPPPQPCRLSTRVDSTKNGSVDTKPERMKKTLMAVQSLTTDVRKGCASLNSCSNILDIFLPRAAESAPAAGHHLGDAAINLRYD
jgi:hypothetical protein